MFPIIWEIYWVNLSLGGELFGLTLKKINSNLMFGTCSTILNFMNCDIGFLIVLLYIPNCDVFLRVKPETCNFNELVEIILQKPHLVSFKVSESHLPTDGICKHQFLRVSYIMQEANLVGNVLSCRWRSNRWSERLTINHFIKYKVVFTLCLGGLLACYEAHSQFFHVSELEFRLEQQSLASVPYPFYQRRLSPSFSFKMNLIYFKYSLS